MFTCVYFLRAVVYQAFWIGVGFQLCLCAEKTQPRSLLDDLVSTCGSVTKIGRKSRLEKNLLLHLSIPSCLHLRYLEIDREELSDSEFQSLRQLAEHKGVDYRFWRANPCYIQLETTDLLILDAEYSYSQLSYELEQFSSRVRKYIYIRNATGPWEYQDDDWYYSSQSGYPSFLYRGCDGPRLPVIEFLKTHPEWIGTSVEGYTLLQRKSEENLLETFHDQEVEAVLQSRLILCTGPSVNRYELLRQVTDADTGLIPFKKIFVVTNDPRIAEIQLKHPLTSRFVIANQSHQLDCTNCILESLKQVALDSEVSDEDIILFKHETVLISDMHLIQQAIRKLLDGYDLVARSWQVPCSRTKGTDAFFVKVAAVRKILHTLHQITEFTPEGTFCEEYITTYVFNQIPRSYDVVYCHSNGWYTELGFYHIPSAAEVGNPAWDRSNYHQLFSQ